MTTENGRSIAVRQPQMDPSTAELGAVLVKSGFFADTKEQAQAIVKVLAGRELGFGPIASMQGVYIVKGRVTLSANLVGAAIKRSGRYDYRVKELNNGRCLLHFFENGKPIGESEFTLEDAKAAGLAQGDNYRKFARNMLFSRALTNGARWYCPDVFNGPIYTPDELGAQVDEEGNVVEAERAVVEPGSFREAKGPVPIPPFDPEQAAKEIETAPPTPMERPRCDADHWRRTYFAIAKDTRFEQEDVRHSFLDWATNSAFQSLGDFLAQATDQEAARLMQTLKDAIEREKAKAAKAAKAQKAEEAAAV